MFVLWLLRKHINQQLVFENVIAFEEHGIQTCICDPGSSHICYVLCALTFAKQSCNISYQQAQQYFQKRTKDLAYAAAIHMRDTNNILRRRRAHFAIRTTCATLYTILSWFILLALPFEKQCIKCASFAFERRKRVRTLIFAALICSIWKWF